MTCGWLSVSEHNPCCSAHGIDMSCEHYRWTHFVEVRPCCAADAALMATEAAHQAGEPRQFQNPKGKGLWVASCSCGKYTCQPQGTSYAATLQVQRHITSKTG